MKKITALFIALTTIILTNVTVAAQETPAVELPAGYTLYEGTVVRINNDAPEFVQPTFVVAVKDKGLNMDGINEATRIVKGPNGKITLVGSNPAVRIVATR